MKNYFNLILRIIVAVILVQTLRYKFTAHPDSVYIFTKVGMEPVGRISIGIIELIASILLLINKTVWMGALLSFGVLMGAVMMHFTILGIEINGDNGTLFYTAVVTSLLSLYLLWNSRSSIPYVNTKF